MLNNNRAEMGAKGLDSWVVEAEVEVELEDEGGCSGGGGGGEGIQCQQWGH